MKKIIRTLALSLLCIFGAAACSTGGFLTDSNGNGSGNGTNNEIAGIWICHDEPGVHFFGFDLSADGTGYYFEWYNDGVEPDQSTYPISYIYNSDKSSLTIIFAGNEYVTSDVVALSSTTLILKFYYDDSESETSVFTLIDRATYSQYMWGII